MLVPGGIQLLFKGCSEIRCLRLFPFESIDLRQNASNELLLALNLVVDSRFASDNIELLFSQSLSDAFFVVAPVAYVIEPRLAFHQQGLNGRAVLIDFRLMLLLEALFDGVAFEFFERSAALLLESDLALGETADLILQTF